MEKSSEPSGKSQGEEKTTTNGQLVVFGRKLFALTLIFNSLLTITCAAGLLRGVYADGWRPYPPLLIDGNLLYLMVAAAVMNIFPSALTGKVRTGRLWFHHYVYGFAVLAAALVWTTLFTPVNILTMFLVNTADPAVNVGRFFALGGLTLVLDDLPDTSKTAEQSLTWLKKKSHVARCALHLLQGVLGVGCLYLLLAICFSLTQTQNSTTAANIILISTLTVTALTSLAILARKTWLKLKLISS